MITYYSQPLIDEQSRPADEYFPLTHLGGLVENPECNGTQYLDQALCTV